MDKNDFFKLLQSLHSLTSEQIVVLSKALPELDTLDIKPSASQIVLAIAESFDKSPVCPHCCSNDIAHWGRQSGYPRYRCKSCAKTFNAMTKTPLARLRIKDKMDEYIDCMRGDTTLRTAAKKCGISLSSSFRMRHRLMAVIEPDKADLLVGISEIDETFFRESFKDQRSLERPARKRGGRKHCGHGKKEQEAVKQIPVMVACDRENHVTDAVLEHISTDELEAHLKCRIQPGSILCADAWRSHASLAKRLNLELKELVTTAGTYVNELPRSKLRGIFCPVYSQSLSKLS